jgi:hypothetical protein
VSAQQTQLKRVRSRIGECVLGFCRLYEGRSFTASQLHQWVDDRMTAAPGSADRILRNLRQRGEVQYTILSRAGSVYLCNAVPA